MIESSSRVALDCHFQTCEQDHRPWTWKSSRTAARVLLTMKRLNSASESGTGWCSVVVLSSTPQPDHQLTHHESACAGGGRTPTVNANPSAKLSRAADAPVMMISATRWSMIHRTWSRGCRNSLQKMTWVTCSHVWHDTKSKLKSNKVAEKSQSQTISAKLSQESNNSKDSKSMWKNFPLAKVKVKAQWFVEVLISLVSEQKSTYKAIHTMPFK